MGLQRSSVCAGASSQQYSNQTHFPKMSFPWLLLLQISEPTTSLLFSEQLTIWEAADVPAAACSLGRRITTSFKAALAVAVPRSWQQLWILPISIQILCIYSGMGQFGWKRLAESQRSVCHLCMVFSMHAPSEPPGKPWKAHFSHPSVCPAFYLPPCPAAGPHLPCCHPYNKFYFTSHQLCPKLPKDPSLRASHPTSLTWSRCRISPLSPITLDPSQCWFFALKRRDIFYLPEPF